MSIHSLRYTPTNYKSIGFTSIKPEMRIAEQVLKEFKQEFPYLQSGSIIRSKIALHEGNLKYKEQIKALHPKMETLDREINKATDILLDKRYMSVNNFLRKIKRLIKKSGKANCGEDFFIIHKSLVDKGLKPQNFQMVAFLNNGKATNHFSTVFNLKKGAKMNNPTTWGSKAIIVDGWKGIAMKANDALEFFKQTLSGNTQINKLEFSDVNFKNYVKIIWKPFS